jgi:hypothetical protein
LKSAYADPPQSDLTRGKEEGNASRPYNRGVGFFSARTHWPDSSRSSDDKKFSTLMSPQAVASLAGGHFAGIDVYRVNANEHGQIVFKQPQISSAGASVAACWLNDYRSRSSQFRLESSFRRCTLGENVREWPELGGSSFEPCPDDQRFARYRLDTG